MMLREIFTRLAMAGLVTGLSVSAATAATSDLAKEKRWADQIVDAIMDGDAEWLNDGTSDYLTIYTETVDESDKAVIVMHGTGIHPDWQQVVQPLRVGLTEHGWNTLSIQMPILRNEAEYEEYAPLYDEVAPRIDAAIAFLKQQGMKKIVLIGHSQGAAMGAYYLRGNNPDVAGFVAIGIGHNAADERMNTLISIGEIRKPMLDLYGDQDLEDIIKLADSRAGVAKRSGNKDYVQEKIVGNHFFDGQDDELVEAVAAWLETVR